MQTVKHPFAGDVKIVQTSLPQAMAWARAMLRRTAADGHAATATTVFDIDDTLIQSKDDAPLPEVVQLYNDIHGLQIPTTIVTARPAKYEDDTKQDLRQCDIGHYDGLHLLPQKYDRDSRIELFKWRRRGQLERGGRKVMLNVGDQWTDHFGLGAMVDALQSMDRDGTYLLMPRGERGRRAMHANLGIKLPDVL